MKWKEVFKRILYGRNATNLKKDVQVDFVKYSYNPVKRIIKANTGSFSIIDFDDSTYVKIKNNENDNVYNVSLNSCECEDFKKNKKPCKHMIYFAIKKGINLDEYLKRDNTKQKFNKYDERIPVFTDYYNGPYLPFGYTNLFMYKVVGYKYGISEKTGKQTKCKKKIFVEAKNEEEAKQIASYKDILPPYCLVEHQYDTPSLNQYNYLEGVGIFYPYTINCIDASALLNRYEEQNFKKCPEYLINLASELNVRVSYFSTEESVIANIWNSLQGKDKIKAYCYYVYCREKKINFGNSNIKPNDKCFDDFEPSSSRKKSYIKSISGEDLKYLNKNIQTYNDAVDFLKKTKLL